MTSRSSIVVRPTVRADFAVHFVVSQLLEVAVHDQPEVRVDHDSYEAEDKPQDTVYYFVIYEEHDGRVNDAHQQTNC